ncbi:MAG: hypothetical protein NTW20_15990 [Rhodobacterales bacterium]|nr:hypothetical protein [Rhodobacterales bacterium]
MDVQFPDHPGLSGSFFPSFRRVAGSAPGPGSIEPVSALAVKLAYLVQADPDPAAGVLTADPDGPVIFDADQIGIALQNADFAAGLQSWQETGGATATIADKIVTLSRAGAGDLRQSAGFGRQLRDRGFGLSVKASGGAGLVTPRPSLLAGAVAGATVTSPPAFPATADQPVLMSAYARFPAGAIAVAVSLRLPAMGADGQTVSYGEPALTTVDFESDLVPEKPEADLIVIADAPPLPISLAVNGVTQLSQAALPVKELTGLAWQDRQTNPRKAEGGDFGAMTQDLPDAFANSYFNGFRRDRRQVPAVPHLTPGDQIVLTREAGPAYGFTLPPDTPVAVQSWFTGDGPDDPALWQSRGIPLVLDTLVIEPDRNRAYTVWRAAWPPQFDAGVPQDLLRRLSVTLQGI